MKASQVPRKPPVGLLIVLKARSSAPLVFRSMASHASRDCSIMNPK